MAIEIVDFPINSMVDLFSSLFVSHYQAGYICHDVHVEIAIIGRLSPGPFFWGPGHLPSGND